MKKLLKFLSVITEVFNIIAMAALVFMLVLVCANVLLRYLFNSPITGTYELTRMCMVCLTPSIAVTILAKKNVWVDVLTSRFGRTGQMIIDIISLPASVVICGLLAWRALTQAMKSYADHVHFTAIKLYEWPFRIVFFAAMCAATLAALAFMLDRFVQYKNGGVPHDETEVEQAIKKAEQMEEGDGQ